MKIQSNGSLITVFSILFSAFFNIVKANVMIIRPQLMPVPENIGIQKPVNMAGAEHNMVGKTLFSSIKFFEYDTSGKRVPCGISCAHFELYRFSTTKGERYFMVSLGLDDNYKPIYIPIKFYLHEYSTGIKNPEHPDYIYFYLADDSLSRPFYKSEISSLYHSYEGDFVGGYFKDTDNPYNWLGMRIVRKSGGFYMLQFFRNGEKNWYELNAWFTYNYGLGYVYGYVENMQDMDALPKCS
ncbi:hypothetical protein HMI55_006342 [Coelomomyces lativittatus]|nr:hypothetical protein HMI55_006342 [Coelomomyces lativittatus]